MVKRKVLVIYHRADYDGIFSGIIAKKYYEKIGCQVKTFGWNYDDEPVDLEREIKTNSIICMVDLSFTAKYMMVLKESGKFVWIDHHETAIQDSQKYGYDKIPGKRTISEAAVTLTWQYFNPKQEVPELIKMIGTYDIWRKEENWQSEIIPLQYGLKKEYGLSFTRILNDWEIMIADFEWLLDDGKAIYTWLQKSSQSWIQNCGFPVTVAGKYKGIAILSPITGSLVFESVQSQYDLFLVIQVRDGGTRYSLSMYTEPEKNLDFSCGEYLKSLQPEAGGHKTAAGMENMTEELFKKLLFEHEI